MFIASSANNDRSPEILNSLRIQKASSQHLYRTFGTSTQGNTWTYSCWVKRGDFTDHNGLFCAGATGWPGEEFGFNGAWVRYVSAAPVGGANNLTKVSSVAYRDPSSWYHVLIRKTASANSSVNCVEISINSVQVTSWTTNAYAGTQASVGNYLNASGQIHRIGWEPAGNVYGDFYIAEVCFVDGQALYPSSFTYTDPITKQLLPLSAAQIRQNVGNWGNNGFYLRFNDTTSTTTLGYDRKVSDTDTSGNNWTLNNFVRSAGTADCLSIDSPVNNFATLNPLSVYVAGGTPQLTNGNLKASATAAAGTGYYRCTMDGRGITQSYFEVYCTSIAGGAGTYIGVASQISTGTSELCYYNAADGVIRLNNVSQGTYATFTTGDIIGVAINGASVSFYKNNVFQATIATGFPREIFPVAGDGSSLAVVLDANFGQYPFHASAQYYPEAGGYFRYEPPAGYKALCTQNIPAPAIMSPKQHFAVNTWTGNGGALVIRDNTQTRPTPSFDVTNSLRMQAASSQYLSRTFGTPTNASVWTLSCWIKRGAMSNGANNRYFFNAGSTTTGDLSVFYPSTPIDSIAIYRGGGLANNTTRVLKDPVEWHNLIFVVNGTNIKVYVDGVLNLDHTMVSAFTQYNTAMTHYFGFASGVSVEAQYFDGYMTEVCFVDGQTLTPTSFGQFDSVTGRWVPLSDSAIRTNVGTWGNNGFYLRFNDTTSTTTLGYDRKVSNSDTSGNNWTLTNFTKSSGSSCCISIDTPTKSFCTLQPLTGSATATRANLDVQSTAAAYQQKYGTIEWTPSMTGKYYFEAVITSTTGSGNNQGMGVNNYYIDCFATSANSTRKLVNGVATNLADTAGVLTTINVAVDCDNRKVYLAINGAWIDSGNPTAGTGGYSMTPGTTYFPFFSGYNSGISTFNFGQAPLHTASTYYPEADGYFWYSPPAGYKALSSKNLPYIANSKHDLFWIKGRSGATDNVLVNTLTGITKKFIANTTADAATDPNVITEVLDGGYIIGNAAAVNTSSATYKGMSWKAGNTTTGVTNNDGSLTSYVSANPIAGISIVRYTGAGTPKTVGHGLGVALSMLIIKAETTASTDRGHVVWHKSFATPTTGGMYLHTQAAEANFASWWNSTVPTSSVFSLNNDPDNNYSGDPFIAICFAEIDGFSKFGSYTGNANADGPFVWCGFRPAWILIKCRTAATTDWHLYDTSVSTFNVASVNTTTSATPVTEATLNGIDILSNGFKLRTITTDPNAAQTYIFAAFAESPFKYSNAR